MPEAADSVYERRHPEGGRVGGGGDEKKLLKLRGGAQTHSLRREARGYERERIAAWSSDPLQRSFTPSHIRHDAGHHHHSVQPKHRKTRTQSHNN